MSKSLSVVLGLLLAALPIMSQAEDSGLVSILQEESKSQSKHKESKGFFSFIASKLPDSFRSKQDLTLTASDVMSMNKTAEKGDLDAQLFLGYAYLYGENGLPVDYNKAFKYYSLAAAQNDAIALNNLGSLYYNGIGVQRDSKQAAELFAKAADKGNVDACVNLGFMLISGEGAHIDKARALAYFEKASTTDNPLAQFMTGYAYYTGALQPANDVKAAKLIKFAADAGFDEAQLVMADLYMSGRGFPQNYSNAVKYLQNAVAQGNVTAMLNEGDILESGVKYPQDIEYAHVLYNLAAVRGAQGAEAKRQRVESKMKIKDILQSQLQADNFEEKVSDLTNYVRKTYGENVRGFIQQ
jgi:hypothetical protein